MDGRWLAWNLGCNFEVKSGQVKPGKGKPSQSLQTPLDVQVTMR
jgi:hypothetical protein